VGTIANMYTFKPNVVLNVSFFNVRINKIKGFVKVSANFIPRSKTSLQPLYSVNGGSVF